MTSNRWRPPQLYNTLYSIAWHFLLSIYPIKCLFGWFTKKVYNPLKHKIKRAWMANFVEREWYGYKIKLRPSSVFRKNLSSWGLEPIILFFNSTSVNFDLRINRFYEINVREDEPITYEWWLCKHNKPVQTPQDGSFFFIRPTGKGTFKFITPKKKDKIFKEVDMESAKFESFVYNCKLNAIDVDRINELDHYTIVMKFTTASGIPSEPFEMASFTIIDRDVFMRNLVLSVGALFIITIFGIALKACGIAY